MGAIEARWMGALLSAAEQGLVDLAESSASEVSFVRHEDEATLREYVGEIERRAQALNFVTARASLREDRAFDSFDALVRTVLAEVTVPGARRSSKRGLLALLDAFLKREGRAALATFDKNLGRIGIGGDLVALARAYLESAKQPTRDAARIEAWLSGVDGAARTAPAAVDVGLVAILDAIVARARARVGFRVPLFRRVTPRVFSRVGTVRAVRGDAAVARIRLYRDASPARAPRKAHHGHECHGNRAQRTLREPGPQRLHHDGLRGSR